MSLNSLGRRLASSARGARAGPRGGACSLLRRVHTRRALAYPIENGLGDFLTPEALRTVAVDWQEGLLQRLNDEVKGSAYENMSVVQTIISTAPDRNRTLAFNYASLALNNSFFLDNLKPPPPGATDHERDIGVALAHSIRIEYGSLAQLKSTVGAAALGMTSAGWVFVVTDGQGRLAVVPTFGPGTLLVRSRLPMMHTDAVALGEELPAQRRAPEQGAGKGAGKGSAPAPVQRGGAPLLRAQDGPRATSPASGVASALRAPNPHTPARTLYASFARRYDKPSLYNDLSPVYKTGVEDENVARIGEKLFPLFCVSVFEHTWMSSGYGVWGKEEYLKRFWTVLDWQKVSDAHAQFNKTGII